MRGVWGKVKSRRELPFFHSRELSCLLNFYFSYINWGKRWVALAAVEGLCNRNLCQSLLNDACKSCVIFSSCFALDLSRPGCSTQAASSAVLQVTCEGPIFPLVPLKPFVSQSCEISSAVMSSTCLGCREPVCGQSLQMSFYYDHDQQSTRGYLRAVISASQLC